MTKEQRIEQKEELVAYIESGCKSEKDWRLGTEHEKFGFHWDTYAPLAYGGPDGIAKILEDLRDDYLWSPVMEGENLIALEGEMGSISLEPGGQLELSGLPLQNVHETCNEIHVHLHQLKSVAQPMGIGFVGMGCTPLWSPEEMEWMPKGRYAIMRQYMPKVGELGLDMMKRTATVQVNLDFSTEQDMVQKFRLSLALQPLVTALYANSPFLEGKKNGYLSYRSAIWQRTDPARCGMLPFVFEEGMGFERYVDYILDVPMYFVRRGGRYIDVAGQSFRNFLQGNLPALPGEFPTFTDFEDHLSTAFPEVRIKRYMEMRGADAGAWCELCALPAFWVGLLYDKDCMAEAWEVVAQWKAADRERIRADVAREGLQTMTPSGTLLQVAKKVLPIAERGLVRRNQCDKKGRDETIYLERLWQTVSSGRTPAEKKIERFDGPWEQSVLPLFEEFAY
ncbi:unnamed protein product [Cyprideis torosa]|uniref:glutamate--cysteine ligase n=1 Tax=Cyprideis torosa TaxID=163714 RepID=A0A7R8WQ95_9CRUS|nr:unnamed protein product [Cyprideis torosa]CAG0905785.1 unnamed protein product [Cyprideis torosa]